MSETSEPSQATNTPPNTDAAKALYSKGYTQYVLGILVVVYTINFIDRQILAILLQSIKTDLGFSDSQIGLLSGAAFGIFYAVLGIPIARLADKYSRVNIISICLVIWSAMTALSGLAQTFTQLLIARIGVGIGEAGGSPPSHSLLADYFTKDVRSTALGIYALGVPIGILFGNFAGGVINDQFGWRSAFLIVGLPGIALALLLKLTLKEPPRGYSDGVKPKVVQVPFIDVFTKMWGYKTFRYMALGAAAQAFVGYGSIAWMPSFLERTHHLTSTQIGTALGLIIGISTGLGTFLGGLIGDKLAKKDVRWYMWLPAAGFLIATPFSFVVYLADSLTVTLAIYIVPSFLVGLYAGPTFGLTQSLAPLAMRSAASALLLFIINIIGLVFGPTTVGFLSDWIQTAYQVTDVDSLRYSLFVCAFVYLFAFYSYFVAAKYIKEDLEAAAKA